MERRYFDNDFVEERSGDVTYFVGFIPFYDGTNKTETTIGTNRYERILDTAFDNVLQDKRNVFALYDHDVKVVLASTDSGSLQLSKEKRGLRYAFPIVPIDPDHTRLQAKVYSKLFTGSSYAWLASGTKDKWHEERGRMVREMHSIPIYEVSPCPAPFYKTSSVGMRSEAELSKEAHDSYWAWQTAIRFAKVK